MTFSAIFTSPRRLTGQFSKSTATLRGARTTSMPLTYGMASAFFARLIVSASPYFFCGMLCLHLVQGPT